MGLLSWLTGKGRPPDGGPDIASPAHKGDPYPFYARLRAESPAHRVTLPDGQTAWLVARYDDVVSVLKDDRFAKDRLNALTPEQAGKQPWVPAMFRPLNRDVRQFPDPDRLDVGREPNRHLSFGLGPHFCLGSPLARLEGQVAIAALLRRAADVRLAVAPGSLRWRRGLVLRGLEALPVAVARWA